MNDSNTTNKRLGKLKVILKECPHCGYPIVLNGPFLNVKCDSCHQKVPLSKSTWKKIFHSLDNLTDNKKKRGSATFEIENVNTLKITMERVRSFQCEACGTSIPSNEIDENGTAVFCFKCGHKHPAFSPDAINFNNAKLVIGGQLSQANGDEYLKPISMSCPNCDGNLSITPNNEKVSSCEYCDGEFLIPNAIWNKLHPVKIASFWHVLFDGISGFRRENEKQRKRKQQQKAQADKWKETQKKQKQKKREQQQREREYDNMQRVLREAEEHNERIKEAKSKISKQRRKFVDVFFSSLGVAAFIGVMGIGFPTSFSETLANLIGPSVCDGIFSAEAYSHPSNSGVNFYCSQSEDQRERFDEFFLYALGVGLAIGIILWIAFVPILVRRHHAKVKILKAEHDTLQEFQP